MKYFLDDPVVLRCLIGWSVLLVVVLVFRNIFDYGGRRDMPAHVEKIGRKWRVVDPDGSPVKNKKGTAVDGGGFDSKQAAARQAAAINIHMHKEGKI